MPLPLSSQTPPYFRFGASRKPIDKKSSRRGFALLITITLLAFLVLLLVSLASLTRVETQVAANTQQLDKARQNALLALNLALGQLQKHAGPDKAVTARADITSASSLTQPYLTGVWKSTNTTSTPDMWLVSGNEISPTAVTPTTAPNPAAGTFPVTADEKVYLLGTGSVSSLAQGVLLSKQPINAPAGSVPGLGATDAPIIGNYAWWVGDEGIKASATMVDQNLTANPLSYNNSGTNLGDDWSATSDLATIRKRNQLNQLQQPRPAIEKILTAVSPTPDTTDQTSLPKLLSLNQLSLLPSASSNTSSAITQSKTAFHDVTLLSSGVLADTSTGKLRTDYSPANTGVGALDTYIKLRPDVPATAANPYISAFYPKAPSWNGVGAPSWPIFGVTPVMSEAALYFTFDVSGGNLNLKYWLMVELWNPYAATITINSANAIKYSVALPLSTLNFNVKQYDRAAFDAATTAVPPTTPVVKASQVFTVTGVGGSIEFSGTTGGNTISIDPGRTLTLRGASTINLSTASVAMGTHSSISTTLAALNSTPAVYTKVDLQTAVPVGTVYKLLLASTNDVLQSCTLNVAYVTTTDTAISNSIGTGLPCLAFGYTFSGSISPFVNDQPANQSWDPRLPVAPAGVSNYQPVTSTSTIWKTNPATNASANNAATFSGGPGTFAQFSTVRVSLYDLPRQEITSIAELRHLSGRYAYGLGTTWAGATNQLFDQAFFSTVPQNYAWPVDGSQPRPNRYLDIYKPASVAPATLVDLRDKANSARYQMIRGAFNINSTSIEAWKAILSSPAQNNWDYPANSPATAASSTTTLTNAFFRTPSGAKEVNGSMLSLSTPSVRSSSSLIGAGNQSRWSAVGRQLPDTEITALATRIVELIKTRGRPYLSLADLIGSPYTGSQGLIEYAINTAKSDVNAGKGLNGDYVGSASTYGPECVTQSDILAKISPFIAARSDTFIIRTYGDNQNPVTNIIESRAWCEATVQRVPDLVSDDTAPVSTVLDPPAASNPFGRKFKIISFRWLSSKDL